MQTRLGRMSLVAGMVALGVVLPPLVHALLVRWKFGMLELSWYVPHEELVEALRSGSPAAMFAAPLWSANMTSGLVIANMYTLGLGELSLSIALGFLLGMNLLAHARPRAACAAGGGPALAAAATSGLLSTLAASGTGILGCCGPALSGGMLALAGLTATSAQAIASVSPAVQSALIAVLAVRWWRGGAMRVGLAVRARSPAPRAAGPVRTRPKVGAAPAAERGS